MKCTSDAIRCFTQLSATPESSGRRLLCSGSGHYSLSLPHSPLCPPLSLSLSLCQQRNATKQRPTAGRTLVPPASLAFGAVYSNSAHVCRPSIWLHEPPGRFHGDGSQTPLRRPKCEACAYYTESAGRLSENVYDPSRRRERDVTITAASQPQMTRC